jgi:hypothetical protein
MNAAKIINSFSTPTQNKLTKAYANTYTAKLLPPRPPKPPTGMVKHGDKQSSIAIRNGMPVRIGRPDSA